MFLQPIPTFKNIDEPLPPVYRYFAEFTAQRMFAELHVR